ncbi:uncharacterized protein MONOS_17506 [Monocercomonoides exilis]|uniref:uncharacterized protein n=1 Tax=Monocercomonoides exilis TaxID=2049356 RepID=UPI003559551D|nr:hypothetical protein MONOS_17506 [Monocercomonoides exilis]
MKGGQVTGVRGICWGMLVGVRYSVIAKRLAQPIFLNTPVRLTKATGQGASEAGYALGLWLDRPCGLAWLYSTYTIFAQSEKVTEAWLMWAEWACGQWLQGWVVGVWLGWLAGRWCWRESSRNKSDGVAEDQGCAVGGVWKSDQITLHFENLGVVHANGAVGWACPAGTMWHTFGWWAVAGPRAVPEKVRIWESSRCHRETRSTLALSIGDIAIEIPQLPLYLWSIY